jgi:hypothetical protein
VAKLLEDYLETMTQGAIENLRNVQKASGAKGLNVRETARAMILMTEGYILEQLCRRHAADLCAGHGHDVENSRPGMFRGRSPAWSEPCRKLAWLDECGMRFSGISSKRSAHSDSLSTMGEDVKADRQFAVPRCWREWDSNCRSALGLDGRRHPEFCSNFADYRRQRTDPESVCWGRPVGIVTANRTST